MRVSIIILRTRKFKLARNEKTSAKVAPIASKGLKNPKSLSLTEIKKVSASALTQTANKKPASKKK